MDSQLKDEFEYYLAHQDKFVKDYNGKVIVLKNHEVLGAYPDEPTAVADTARSEELGTFLVQKVEPGTGAYTQTFYSRVAFSV